MIIKGKLITCKREVKEFKGKEQKEKLYVTLAAVELSKKQMEKLQEAFKDAGKNFTPAWIKKFEGYVNIATEFELPYIDVDGNRYTSIEPDLNKDLKWRKAECELSLNIKDGAVYPNAIKFTSEGEAFNPFAEFDNEEED